MTSLQPQLAVRRGRDAVRFYEEAFGAVVVYRIGGTDESPSVVAQLPMGTPCSGSRTSRPSTANLSPETLGGGTVRMTLVVDDPDAVAARAIAAGATEVHP